MSFSENFSRQDVGGTTQSTRYSPIIQSAYLVYKRKAFVTAVTQQRLHVSRTLLDVLYVAKYWKRTSISGTVRLSFFREHLKTPRSVAFRCLIVIRESAP